MTDSYALRTSGGWTTIGIFVVLGAATGGALLASFALRISPNDFSVPWFILSAMLIPMAFAITAWMKLNDLHSDSEGLNRDEKRRLSHIVEEKLRQVHIGIAFYVVSALFSLFLMMVGGDSQSILSWAVPVLGGLLAISLSSIGFLLAQLREVSKFLAMLKDRNAARRSKAKLRKRLNHPRTN
ncbi:hypothetical protein B9Q17_08150 [Marinobacter vinifirmus]|uniref:DUF2721 domain-containing protein n=1 Tax=Marinobacter vinifirmus TaxID=355591 RepID=A0A7Z1IN73_9GAMM|nr:hypothetical protein [Marinobacter vinifirmus]OZC36744.1 hypothetical protein B9Q17_08150 [Marinobacter vinifirmus]